MEEVFAAVINLNGSGDLQQRGREDGAGRIPYGRSVAAHAATG